VAGLIVDDAKARAALDDWEWSNLRRVLHKVANSIWTRRIHWVRKGIRGLSLDDYAALAERGYELGSISATRLERIAELIARKAVAGDDQVPDQDLLARCSHLSKYAQFTKGRRRQKEAAAQPRPDRRKFSDVDLLMCMNAFSIRKDGKQRGMVSIIARKLKVSPTAVRTRMKEMAKKKIET
jgi:hypothetical protein